MSTMIARILCRFGLHKWKPVMRLPGTYVRWHSRLGFVPPAEIYLLGKLEHRVEQVGHKCRRCGKRVKL